MKCDTCGTTLKKFVLLNTKSGSETLCPVCQKSLIDEIKELNKACISNSLKELNVPSRYWNAALTREYLAFTSYDAVKSGKKGIYLFGESGVGKTWLLVAWLKHCLSSGMKCVYVDWSDFMVDMKLDAKAYRQFRANALQADCIFIDDFDGSNPYTYDIVYNFINSLYKSNKRMFFTSVDLPVQPKLAMRIGESTVQLQIVRS